MHDHDYDVGPIDNISTNGIRKTFCDIATAAAELSEHHFRVGSVIVKGHRVISLGVNQKNKTNPLAQKRMPNRTMVDKLHAEQMSMLRARTDLRGAKIYIARRIVNGLGNARPCKMCMAMLIEVGIKKIYYSTDNNNWVCEKIK